MSQALLDIEDLVVQYPRKARRPAAKAVDGASLSIAPGEVVGLVGESGSGKTTLAMAILGLAPVTAGRISFIGKDLAGLSPRGRRALSRDIQVVFQDPYSSLNPTRTIAQTLSEPLDVHERLTRADRHQRVIEALHRVGLPADAATRYPAEFSGGQRQRIAIARALIVSPQLIICDEAVSALDLSVQAQILNLLADARRDLSIACLFLSHDLAVVRYLCSSVAVLYRGQVVESGPASSVCYQPAHSYTQALLAAEPDPTRARRQERDARTHITGGA